MVRYIAAVSLDMISQLHERNIVYRDLKPENIEVMCDTGCLYLSDFTFDKESCKLGRTFTRCGSQGYQAPEVLLQANENHSSF